MTQDIYIANIRDWEENEKLPTSEGYLNLPNKFYQTRTIEEDEEGFNIEFFFLGKWLKGMNIDFE